MGKRPHVVVLPLGLKGHVNPMLIFSKLLAEQGIIITFINTEVNHKQMVEAEKLSIAGLDIRFEQLPDGLPAVYDRTGNVLELCESQASTMAKPFDALLARLVDQDPPPSCILADTLLTFTVESASIFGLPHGSFWTQSAASFASSLMVARGYRPPQELKVPGANFLQATDLNTHLQSYDPTQFIFRFLTECYDHISKSRWIFMNTFEDLEEETLNALRTGEGLHGLLAIGPLLPSPFLKQEKGASGHDNAHVDGSIEEGDKSVEEDKCRRWLDKFEPNSVLYVSFGSLALVSAQQMEEIALGLEASGYPFVWVTRPDLIYGESPNFTASFLERVKERAYFTPWASQLEILNHKAIGGFFTHGGWNSTLEGIVAGVPMLGWPYFSDQPMGCKSIELGWKIGLRLLEDDDAKERKLVPRNIVEAKVRLLMTSPAFSRRAREWSALAKKAASQDGSSLSSIQSFLNALT